MKKVLLAIVCMATLGVMAAPIRLMVQVVPLKDGAIALTPTPKEPGLYGMRNFTWGPEDQRPCSVFGNARVTDQYRTYKFAFTPQDSGKVRLDVIGGREKSGEADGKATYAMRQIAFKNLCLNGTPVPNADYKDFSDAGRLRIKGFALGKDCRLIEDNTALTATNLSRISLQIPVEAGQRYEIAVDAKLLAE